MFNSVFNPEVVFGSNTTSEDKPTPVRGERYWTEERQELLKKELPTASDARLAELFPGKTLSALKSRGRKNGIKRLDSPERIAERHRKSILTPAQTKYVLEHPQMSAEALANKLNVFVHCVKVLRNTTASVAARAAAKAPEVRKEVVSIAINKKLTPRTHARTDPWTLTEETFLSDNINAKSTNELAIILDRTPGQIRTKARAMNLYALPFVHPNPNRHE